MNSSSYSPYIRDHGSSIRSVYGLSIDILYNILDNWHVRECHSRQRHARLSHIRNQSTCTRTCQFVKIRRVMCSSSRTESPWLEVPAHLLKFCHLKVDLSNEPVRATSQCALDTAMFGLKHYITVPIGLGKSASAGISRFACP